MEYIKCQGVAFENDYLYVSGLLRYQRACKNKIKRHFPIAESKGYWACTNDQFF